MALQIGDDILFIAYFTNGGISASGLTVDIDVSRDDGTSVVIGQSTTDVGTGHYSYTLAGASVTVNGGYVARFRTAGTADQQHVSDVHYVGVFNDPATSEIADGVWDEAIAGHVGAGSFGEEVQGHATPVEVKAEADQALVDYDPPTKAELDTAESNITTAVSNAHSTTDAAIAALNDLSSSDVENAVWDAAIAGHVGAGSFGEEVQTHATPAEAADAVWDEAIAGHVVAGSFGEEVQGHATPAEVKAEADQALVDYDPSTSTELSTTESNITTAITNAHATTDTAISELNDLSSGDVENAVWDAAIAGHVAAGSFGEEVQGHATPSEVKAEADQALVDYDPPTKAELDTAESNITTAVTNAHSTTDAAIAALNDLSSGDVENAVWNAAIAGHVGAGSFGEEVQAHATPAEAADAVWDEMTVGHVVPGSFSVEVQGHATPEQAADAVWDEMIAEHNVVGSFGEEVQGHATPDEAADAVWDEAIAGHVAAGSFGEEVQSHATPAEVKAETDQALVDYGPSTSTELSTTESNITTAITNAHAATDTAIAELNDLSSGDVENAVWDAATASHTTADTFGGEILVGDNLVSVAQTIVDEMLKRGIANVEDDADTYSLAAVVLATLKSSFSGATWTIKKTDGTDFAVRTVTVDADALPIVGVD